MLESIVDLLHGLALVALILLMAFSILGSIVAALRAVSRASATSESNRGRCVYEIQLFERPLGERMRSANGALNPVGPEKSRSRP